MKHSVNLYKKRILSSRYFKQARIRCSSKAPVSGNVVRVLIFFRVFHVTPEMVSHMNGFVQFPIVVVFLQALLHHLTTAVDLVIIKRYVNAQVS